MLDVTTFLVLGFVYTVLSGYALVALTRSHRQTGKQLGLTLDKVVEIQEQSGKGTDTASAEIIEELESLKRRQTNLEKDVVDRMKIVAQRERRIVERMSGDEDDEASPEQIEEGRRLLSTAGNGNAQPEPSDQNDQLDWVRSHLRG